jgi:hypothetical protein
MQTLGGHSLHAGTYPNAFKTKFPKRDNWFRFYNWKQKKILRQFSGIFGIVLGICESWGIKLWIYIYRVQIVASRCRAGLPQPWEEYSYGGAMVTADSDEYSKKLTVAQAATSMSMFLAKCVQFRLDTWHLSLLLRLTPSCPLQRLWWQAMWLPLPFVFCLLCELLVWWSRSPLFERDAVYLSCVACFLFMLCLQCTAKMSDVGLRR